MQMTKKKLAKYWKQLTKLEASFYKKIKALEHKMSKEFMISDIEFFWCDNEIVGIGNASKTMHLIHRKYDE